jgi:hypothetical protein
MKQDCNPTHRGAAAIAIKHPESLQHRVSPKSRYPAQPWLHHDLIRPMTILRDTIALRLQHSISAELNQLLRIGRQYRVKFSGSLDGS